MHTEELSATGSTTRPNGSEWIMQSSPSQSRDAVGNVAKRSLDSAQSAKFHYMSTALDLIMLFIHCVQIITSKNAKCRTEHTSVVGLHASFASACHCCIIMTVMCSVSF